MCIQAALPCGRKVRWCPQPWLSREGLTWTRGSGLRVLGSKGCPFALGAQHGLCERSNAHSTGKPRCRATAHGWHRACRSASLEGHHAGHPCPCPLPQPPATRELLPVAHPQPLAPALQGSRQGGCVCACVSAAGKAKGGQPLPKDTSFTSPHMPVHSAPMATAPPRPQPQGHALSDPLTRLGSSLKRSQRQPMDLSSQHWAPSANASCKMKPGQPPLPSHHVLRPFLTQGCFLSQPPSPGPQLLPPCPSHPQQPGFISCS